jgi:hypothetical protein
VATADREATMLQLQLHDPRNGMVVLDDQDSGSWPHVATQSNSLPG